MISQQVNKCSNKEQHLHVPTRNRLQSSPATNNAIRGAEQSGNIAKQWFARKGEKVRGYFMAIGRLDKQVVGSGT